MSELFSSAEFSPSTPIPISIQTSIAGFIAIFVNECIGDFALFEAIDELHRASKNHSIRSVGASDIWE